MEVSTIRVSGWDQEVTGVSTIRVSGWVQEVPTGEAKIESSGAKLVEV